MSQAHDRNDSIETILNRSVLQEQALQPSPKVNSSLTENNPREQCIKGSHSSTECRGTDDTKRKAGNGRSKSFFEEPLCLKVTNFMQGLTDTERNTYGSHGDGLANDQNAENKRTDSCEKKREKQRKLQLLDSSNQAFGVSQNLFDPQLTFADLVRVCSSEESQNVSSKQLGNSLLSKAHASNFVSSYLNTYRGYLDSLRQTPGREQIDASQISKIVKNIPQVLPLALIEDSHDDPEVLLLLRKTTTESIRKLWPNKVKITRIRGADLTDCATKESKQEDEKKLQPETKVNNVEEKSEDKVKQTENIRLIKLNLKDNDKCKLVMTSVASDSFAIGDAASHPKSEAVSIPGNVLHQSSRITPSSYDWGKPTMTETTSVEQQQQQPIQPQQQPRSHFPTGSLLKHQQKLIHQHNLQCQILKRQQQLQQQQEQQIQQQQQQQQQHQQHIHSQQSLQSLNQRLQQHQQQQHHHHQQQQLSLHGFQLNDQQDRHSEFSCLHSSGNSFEGDSEEKPWFSRSFSNHPDNSNASTFNYHLTPRHSISDNCNNSQLLTTGSNTVLLQSMTQAEFERKNQFQEQIDPFNDPRRKFYQEEAPRTLKASYACLDPSSPMALSRLEPLSASPLTDLGTTFNHLENSQNRQTTDYNFYNTYGDLLGDKGNAQSWGDQTYSNKSGGYKENSDYDEQLRGAIGRPHFDNSFGMLGRQHQTRTPIKRDIQHNSKSECIENDQQMFLDFASLRNSQEQSPFSNNDRSGDWGSVAIDELLTNGAAKKSAGSTIEQSRSSQIGDWGREGLPSDLTLSHTFGSLGTPEKNRHIEGKGSTNSSREMPNSWADATARGTNSVLFPISEHNTKRTEPQMQFSNNNNACWTNKDRFDNTKDSSLILDHMMETDRSSKWFQKDRQSTLNNGNSNESSDNLNRKVLDHTRGKLTVGSRLSSLNARNNASDGNTDAHKITSSASSPGENTRNKEYNINRTPGDNTDLPHSSASFPQINQLHQQSHNFDKLKRIEKKAEQDDTILKLSKDFENTFLDENISSPPWHELSMPPNVPEKRNEYIKVRNFDGATMILSDTELSLYSDKDKRPYRTEGDSASETNSEPQRPRMILGNSKNIRKPTNEAEQLDIEEGNRKLREMLGLPETRCEKDMTSFTPIQQQATMPIPDLQPQTHYTAVHDPTNQRFPGLYQQSNIQTIGSNPLTRVQFSGNKIPQHIGMPQQMYCMAPNILVPPPQISGQGPNRGQVLYPQMIQNANTTSRVPQGMIRVPLVYMQPMPMGMAGVHPINNNHNNSSSSNPHVNTSNIITINTSENDFSNGDKGIRGLKTNIPKMKPTLLKMRQAHDEFAGNFHAFNATVEEHQNPRLRRTRTNPWDSDLDHDFSNSLISKVNSLDNLSGTSAQSEVLDYNSMGFSEMSGYKVESEPSSFEQKTNPQMQQWSAAADIHPEQLDMLPVKRPMPEESTGRVCWPDMELMIPANRDHLQATRRSNKPMGSNRANLIAIIPKTGTEP